MATHKRWLEVIFALVMLFFPAATYPQVDAAIRQIIVEQTLDMMEVKVLSAPAINENLSPSQKEQYENIKRQMNPQLSSAREEGASSTGFKNFLFGKDALANIALGLQTGDIAGYTKYHISFDNPIEIGGHGESELEWPLSSTLMGIDAAFNYKGNQKSAFSVPNKASLRILWLTRLDEDAGKMKDSDWIENDVGFIDYYDDGTLNGSAFWASNNDGLDIYSKSVAKLDKGDILDLNYTYNFLTNNITGLGIMAGFRYQNFLFSAYSLDQVGYGPYGPGPYDLTFQDTRGLKWGEYKVNSTIPYLGLSSELAWRDKISFLFNFGYSGWVTIRDQDTHLYPTTDEALGMNYDMISKGKSDGQAYLIDTKGNWRLAPAWLLSLGATFVTINTKGSMQQRQYLDGVLTGESEPIEEKVKSRYWLLSISLKYVF